MTTDLDEIYACSRAMATHAHEAIYHLAVFQSLCRRALAIVTQRLDPQTNAIEYHPDLDQRALVEIALFPAFWRETIEPLVDIIETVQQLLDSAVADAIPISKSPLQGDWETTAYPIFWREASLRLLRQRYPQMPWRRLLSDLLRTPSDSPEPTRLYQSQAFQERRWEETEEEDDGEEDETENDFPNGTA